jgi:hypothetical protein
MRSAIVGAIMLVGVASGTVYAQEVGDDEGGGESGPGCGRPQWVCVHEPSHKNQGPAPSGLSELHGACLYCLPWGDPEDCHDSCLISPEPAYQLAYQTIRNAARAGNVGAIIRLIPLAADFVLYNAERKSLQVMGCDGKGVIANFAVTDAESKDVRIARASSPRSKLGRDALAYLAVRRGLPRHSERIPHQASVTSGGSFRLSRACARLALV